MLDSGNTFGVSTIKIRVSTSLVSITIRSSRYRRFYSWTFCCVSWYKKQKRGESDFMFDSIVFAPNWFLTSSLSFNRKKRNGALFSSSVSSFLSFISWDDDRSSMEGNKKTSMKLTRETERCKETGRKEKDASPKKVSMLDKNRTKGRIRWRKRKSPWKAWQKDTHRKRKEKPNKKRTVLCLQRREIVV